MWCQLLKCEDAKVLIKKEAMLRLSDFCFPQDLLSVGCGSAVCDAINVWSFGDPDKKWSVKVTDILKKFGFNSGFS